MIGKYNLKTSILAYTSLIIPLCYGVYLYHRGIPFLAATFYLSLLFLIIYLLINRRLYWVKASANHLQVQFFSPFKKNFLINCEDIFEIELEGVDSIDFVRSIFFRTPIVLHITVISEGQIDHYSLPNNMTFQVAELYKLLEKYIILTRDSPARFNSKEKIVSNRSSNE